MRHVLLLAAATLPLAAIPAVSGQTRPASQPALQPSAPPRTTLLQPGAVPRQVLRLAPRIGARHAIDVTMKLTGEQSVNGALVPPQPSPGIVMSFELVVTDLTPGRIGYAFECIKADVVADPAIPAPLMEMIRSGITPVVGLRGTGVMSDRAESLGITVTQPPDMDPAMVTHVSAIEQLLGQLTTPFPVEPVGVGGSWEVARTIDQDGFAVQQTIVCTLEASDGATIEIAMDLRQQAEPQPIRETGMPPGMAANLTSYSSHGAGRTVHRLNTLFPADGNMTVTNDRAITRTLGGRRWEMIQHAVMTSSLKGR